MIYIHAYSHQLSWGMCENIQALVVDIGSHLCRAGFAGDDVPRVIFPSVIGRPYIVNGSVSMGCKPIYVGDDAASRRGVLSLSYPIQRGIVTDWEDMEKILHRTFNNQVFLAPEEHPLLLSEPPLNPKRDKESLIELVFETFNFPATYIALQGLLSVYASGRSNVVVLSIGEGVAHTLAVAHGYVICNSIKRKEVAGCDLTEYLMKILTHRGYSFTNSTEREIAREMKERLCYVAADYKKEISLARSSSSIERTYQLPDGQVFVVGEERFRCPEALFNPLLLQRESDGIHEFLYGAIQECDVDVRSDLLGNIVLSGGSTLLPGFGERLCKEIDSLIPSNAHAEVVSLPERKYMVWTGGSMLASLSTFQQMWLTKQEYEERGIGYIHKRLF